MRAALVLMMLVLGGCVPMLSVTEQQPPLQLPTGTISSLSGKTTVLASLLLRDETVLVLVPAPEAIPEARSWEAAMSGYRSKTRNDAYILLVLPQDMGAYDVLLRDEYKEQFKDMKGYSDVYIAYADVEDFFIRLDSDAGKAAVILRVSNNHKIIGRTAGGYSPEKAAQLAEKVR